MMKLELKDFIIYKFIMNNDIMYLFSVAILQ